MKITDIKAFPVRVVQHYREFLLGHPNIVW